MKPTNRLKDLIAARARSGPALQVRAAADGAAEILLYDEIGFFGISAAEFAKELSAIKAATIRLRINSPGGDVFDGLAIYNSLRGHAATTGAAIEAVIEGLAASAASFIALAASRVSMAKNAFYMIHNAWGLVIGNKTDMRDMAEVLAKIDGQLAEIYAAKTGKKQSEIGALMDAETWFTAEEAKQAGFVDEVLDMAAPKASIAAGIFNHPPAQLTLRAGDKSVHHVIKIAEGAGSAAPSEQIDTAAIAARMGRRLRLIEAE